MKKLRGHLSIGIVLFACLILYMAAVAVVVIVNVSGRIGKPFPGFLYYKIPAVGNMGDPEWAGIKAGVHYRDVIVEVNGENIATGADLERIINQAEAGDEVTYVFDRRGEKRKLSIAVSLFTLGDALKVFGIPSLMGFTFWFIGLIVYLLKPDTTTTWVFLLGCLSVGTYLITGSEAHSNSTSAYLLSTLSQTLIASTFIHLSLVFPERTKLIQKAPSLPIALYAVSIALFVYHSHYFLALTSARHPTDTILSNTSAILPAVYLTRFYILLAAVAIVTSGLVAYSRSSSVIAKQRARIILFSSSLAFIPPTFIQAATSLGQLAVPFNLTAPFVVVFPAAIGFAIARHNLFDVDVYIKRTMGYVIMTVLVGMGYFSIESLTATVILKPILGESAQKASPIIFALLVVLLFNPVHSRVQDLVDKTFFRKRFDYKQVINSVGNALTSVVALGDIITRIISIIRKEMFIDTAGVIVLDQEKQSCQTFMIGDGASPVRDLTKDVCMTPDDPLLLLLSQEKKLITKYDIAEDPHYVSVREPCGQRFAELGASLAMPLIYQDRLTGVLALGYKKSGHFYTREDVEALKTIADQGAVAIEQARLFEEAKLAEVVRLLGDIGHDLKNLLQPVVSGAWLLKGELDEVFDNLPALDPGKAQASKGLCDEAIGMIRRTSDRIHDRVKEIADCVKGLSAPPQFKPCKVASVVEDVLQTLRVLAAEKDIALHCKDLDTLPTILADERRLYNAFYNLVNNAIPEVAKGGSITTSGRADPAAGVIYVSVADTGRGMPPEVRDRLFTARAVSTKATGTGLGTKIVKDVVDAHRGQITVESEVGVGTTFHIRLPLDPTRPQST